MGRSRLQKALRRRIAALAALRSTLLVCGETGTGKGLVARHLHARSDRAREPFVHLDCGALAPSVVESELFGHERGAFTGALAQRRGCFERAGRGTLFLDEIGELPQALQIKLLRVLEDRSFERVGGGATLRMRARIVAATSRDLRREVETGRFRADLYYRLAVLLVRVPPLRERLEDLPELVTRALARIARETGASPAAPCAEAYTALAAHAWPGNVRELHNLLERLLAEEPEAPLDRARVAAALADSPGATRTPPELTVAGREESHGLESLRVAAALAASGGNVARAARRLGLARSTLRHRIARLGLGHLIPRD